MNFDPFSTLNDAVTMTVEKPLLAGRYRVVRQLGQGGMGSVWLAEDTTLDNRLVALKMLPTILVANKRAYNQLKSEALVSLKLSHPNIAALRSFENNDGNPFLVMDYIDGESLDDHLAEKGKLTPEETRRLLAPIAAALDYAHTCGVVHRDVKPGNVMIARNGTPYILDFGIAREIEETMTRMTGKNSSGTLMYMSPEQLDGDKPTAAQDVYSFAAMVYECLMGEAPFVRGAIEDQIRHKTPAPLEGADVLDQSVMQGLAKDPAARPPTCAAVLEGAVRPAARAPSGASAMPARKLLLPIAAVLGGLLLVGVNVSSLVTRVRSEREERITHEKSAREETKTRIVADAIAAFKLKDCARGYALAQQTDLTNADIQYYLGKCYYQGNVVAKDYAESVKWWSKAAEQGHADAQCLLGMCCEYGTGLPKDNAEAVKWYRKAADQGDAMAQELLRLACGEVARAEAAREEQEKAAREKAEREEAERVAREKAAREETERIAREKAAKAEAERVAREKAAREETERIAREKVAKAEAERVARVEAKFGVVQLWKDGPYWAKCNVGATKPEEYGYYFWWGGTVGYKRNVRNDTWMSVKDGSSFKFEPDSENCPTYGKNITRLNSAGYIDSTGNLASEYDTAWAYLGPPWRMPTKAEMDALINNCSITWITTNGINGVLVTGIEAYASKRIFLPAAGYGSHSDLNETGSYCNYWSSTPTSEDSDCAWGMHFTEDFFLKQDYSPRCSGRSVRPVLGFAK